MVSSFTIFTVIWAPLWFGGWYLLQSFSLNFAFVGYGDPEGLPWLCKEIHSPQAERRRWPSLHTGLHRDEKDWEWEGPGVCVPKATGISYSIGWSPCPHASVRHGGNTRCRRGSQVGFHFCFIKYIWKFFQIIFIYVYYIYLIGVLHVHHIQKYLTYTMAFRIMEREVSGRPSYIRWPWGRQYELGWSLSNSRSDYGSDLICIKTQVKVIPENLSESICISHLKISNPLPSEIFIHTG